MEAEDLISKAALALDGNTVVVAYDKDLLQIVGQPGQGQAKERRILLQPTKEAPADPPELGQPHSRRL